MSRPKSHPKANLLPKKMTKVGGGWMGGRSGTAVRQCEGQHMPCLARGVRACADALVVAKKGEGCCALDLSGPESQLHALRFSALFVLIPAGGAQGAAQKAAQGGAQQRGGRGG